MRIVVDLRGVSVAQLVGLFPALIIRNVDLLGQCSHSFLVCQLFFLKLLSHLGEQLLGCLTLRLVAALRYLPILLLLCVVGRVLKVRHRGLRGREPSEAKARRPRLGRHLRAWCQHLRVAGRTLRDKWHIHHHSASPATVAVVPCVIRGRTRLGRAGCDRVTQVNGLDIDLNVVLVLGQLEEHWVVLRSQVDLVSQLLGLAVVGQVEVALSDGDLLVVAQQNHL